MADDDDRDLRRRLERSRSQSSRRDRRSRSGGARTGRSRSRSASRTSSRSRSRTREPRRRRRSKSGSGLSRSPSRELYEEDPPARLATLVKSQQDFLLDLLEEHKHEVEDKLQARQRRFASKQIEKQFEVNSGFQKLAKAALAALGAKDYRRANNALEELCNNLEVHSQDLIIADTSPHGWLAVSKIRAGTDLPKNLRKRLDQVDRELAAQRYRDNGGAGKKLFQVPKEGQGPLIRRDNRRISPEEALSYASKQIRAGACSHCKKEYHYYRECPAFWQKVQESREAEAKKTAD